MREDPVQLRRPADGHRDAVGLWPPRPGGDAGHPPGGPGGHGLDRRGGDGARGADRVGDHRHPGPPGAAPTGHRLGPRPELPQPRAGGGRRLRRGRDRTSAGHRRRPAPAGGPDRWAAGRRRHLQRGPRGRDRGCRDLPRRRQPHAPGVAPQRRLGLHHLPRGRGPLRRPGQGGRRGPARRPDRDAPVPGVRPLRPRPPRAGQLRGPQHPRLPVGPRRPPVRRVAAGRLRLGPLAPSVRPDPAPRPAGDQLLLPHGAGGPDQRHRRHRRVGGPGALAIPRRATAPGACAHRHVPGDLGDLHR